MTEIKEKIIQVAFAEAQKAFTEDEVPVGAVVFNTQTGEIIAKAHNKIVQHKDATAHAERLAISKACNKLKTDKLTGYSLFATLEPCVMCAGAIALSRLDAVYYGAVDPKTGGIEQGAKVFTHPQTHHKPKHIENLKIPSCGQILTDFFKGKRKS